jgi:hypothetical protein
MVHSTIITNESNLLGSRAFCQTQLQFTWIWFSKGMVVKRQRLNLQKNELHSQTQATIMNKNKFAQKKV